jgi:geranyl-CoA carboxylase alpha subunit
MKVLIANRGEIACRIARACKERGLQPVAVFSDADAGSAHVEACDLAVRIGPAPVAESYLNVPALLDAAKQSGADAVHPGYGFLSENAGFAQAVMDAGLVWIGPPPAAIELMGDKARSKAAMREAGVPVLPGVEGDVEQLRAAAADVGYPLLVKAVAGGGGRGLRVVEEAEGLDAALTSAAAEAAAAFGNGELMIERWVPRGRHVEVQVLGDEHGTIVAIGERECSVQRRHQKVIEEAPSPSVGWDLRAQLEDAAVKAAAACDYVGAGTVEFLLEDSGAFWFLEMNTRLQVEHPVTEMVHGVDLVQCQLGIASGSELPEPLSEGAEGHSIEARLYAEDPARGYLPQVGPILRWDPPEGVRVDTGVRAGDEVAAHYDPMIAKLISWGSDREEARRRLVTALRDAPLLGVQTNQSFLIEVLESAEFVTNDLHTRWLDELGAWDPPPPPGAVDAVAAVIVSLDDPTGARPWHSRGAHDWPIALERSGDVVELRVAPKGHAYEVGGVEVRCLDGADGFEVCVDGARYPAVFVKDGRTLHLAIPGLGRGVYTEPDPLDRAAAAAEGDGRLKAPTTGKVVRVEAAVGDAVEVGAPIVVLEAMKMEHPVRADVAGTVTEVRVTVGDQVRGGEVLAVVETA